MISRLLLAALLAAGLTGLAAAQEKKDQKKDDPNAEKERKGTVVGVVAAKGDNWIEVKADGEEKARRYMRHGGNPGTDKATLELMVKVPIGSRVRLEWIFAERARVMKLEVLQAAKGDEKKGDE